MFHEQQLTGAIFCGGRSSRMGTPKAGLRLGNGLSMVEQVYTALAPLCSSVVLVGHGEGVPVHVLNRLPLIPDRVPGRGPLGGLEALLRSGRNTDYLVCPCDLPKANAQLFRLLLQAERTPAVLAVRHRLHPLIGIYSRAHLSRVQDQLFHRRLKMTDLLAHLSYQSIPVPADLESALTNANTPTDLECV